MMNSAYINGLLKLADKHIANDLVRICVIFIERRSMKTATLSDAATFSEFKRYVENLEFLLKLMGEDISRIPLVEPNRRVDDSFEDLEFEIGQCVGEMHCHQPSSHSSLIFKAGWKAGMPFEIGEDLADEIAVRIKATHTIRRENKMAYVVSSQPNTALVIYQYDHRFYLTQIGKNL